jgi:hypothetical protein
MAEDEMGGQVFITFFIGAGFVGLGLFLRSYLVEKGKSLATKEDIHHLTDAVEGIKAKYATVNQVQQIQFEKEFDTYVEIMAKLVSLQSTTLSLRPTGLILGRVPETEENKRHRKELDF